MKKPRISSGLAEVENTKRNKLMHFDVGESLYKWPIERIKAEQNRASSLFVAIKPSSGTKSCTSM